MMPASPERLRKRRKEIVLRKFAITMRDEQYRINASGTNTAAWLVGCIDPNSMLRHGENCFGNIFPKSGENTGNIY